jgi:hypothetical protein
MKPLSSSVMFLYNVSDTHPCLFNQRDPNGNIDGDPSQGQEMVEGGETELLRRVLRATSATIQTLI